VLQTTLRDAHGIKTVRRTLAEIDAMCTIGSDGLLTVGNNVASVVYFRAGCAKIAVGVVHCLSFLTQSVSLSCQLHARRFSDGG
jgi:Eukaryotic glutathione synthase